MQIRRAIRTFKTSTSIGGDLWAFRDIAHMPDHALAALGKIMATAAGTAVPPLQALFNIMAMIPKKTGHRTIAIMATFHRILMQLETEEIKTFTEANAYCKDTATAGASAVHSSEMRAAEAELNAAEGNITITALIDIQNFVRLCRHPQAVP